MRRCGPVPAFVRRLRSSGWRRAAALREGFRAGHPAGRPARARGSRTTALARRCSRRSASTPCCRPSTGRSSSSTVPRDVIVVGGGNGGSAAPDVGGLRDDRGAALHRLRRLDAAVDDAGGSGARENGWSNAARASPACSRPSGRASSSPRRWWAGGLLGPQNVLRRGDHHCHAFVESMLPCRALQRRPPPRTRHRAGRAPAAARSDRPRSGSRMRLAGERM
jgi:hypothetical protein